MEIAPIAAIRAIPAVKPRPVDSELTALFDIEAAARPGDDTWTRSGRKAAGAEEDEEELDELEEIEDFQEGPPLTRWSAASSGSQISFFV